MIAPFLGGTHDWQASEKSFTVAAGKTVSEIWLYALYRNDPITPSGVAYFDDIEIIVIPPAPSWYANGWKALDNVKFLEGNRFSIDKHGGKLHNGYVIADRVPINNTQIPSEGVWTMKNQKKNWIRCSYFEPELFVARGNTNFKWDFEKYSRKCTKDDEFVKDNQLQNDGTPAEPEKHAVKCCSSKINNSKGEQTLIASSADENVALNKPTEVSSTFLNNAAGSAAVDGTTDTFFHSNGGSSSVDEYFQVDLQQIFRVDRYVSVCYVYKCCVLLTRCTHHT